MPDSLGQPELSRSKGKGEYKPMRYSTFCVLCVQGPLLCKAKHVLTHSGEFSIYGGFHD